ncbi:MAG: cyclodeaminase/cyclohydrolase family protein [Candidatus Thalassarchaeaceae archaeon]|nr:cyclodeaminase/cyclohydrolase family protein [Candidatus Thalassarchaeaceae archaeon]
MMNDGYMSILEKIGSESPTPGGGTVAALTLAHAHSLAAMVSRLTIGKEKWQEGHKISNLIINSSAESLERSILLAENDSLAFDKVMASYRMPRNNDVEVESRKLAILESTIGAAQTPSEIAQEGLKLLSILPDLARFGNLNAITDLAASSELAYTAVYIASLNVKINVDSMNNKELDRIQEDTTIILTKSKELIMQIREIVSGRMEI